MTDKNSSQVDLHPTKATVEELANLPRPPSLGEDDRAEEERKTFTVVATVTALKLESDGDYHLVLQGANGETLVAEVPSPGCYSGNNADIRTDFQGARDLVDEALIHGAAKQATMRVQSNAEITGVGFFDRTHGQLGMAPNGFELHPVLSIRFLQDQKSGATGARPAQQLIRPQS